MTSPKVRRAARPATLVALAAVVPLLLGGCAEGSPGGGSPGGEVDSLTVGLSQNPETG